MNTLAFVFYNIKDEDTGEVVSYPQRQWNEATKEAIYEAFKDSEHYKQHLKDHPGKTICYTHFFKFACPCVRIHGPQSCIDINLSKTNEYQKSC